ANTGHPAQLVHRRSREPVKTADRNQHRIGKFERAGTRSAVAKHDCEQFVVAKTHGTEALELFTWSISLGNLFHGRYLLLLYFTRCVACRRSDSCCCWQRAARSPPRRKSTRPRVQSTPRVRPARISTP